MLPADYSSADGICPRRFHNRIVLYHTAVLALLGRPERCIICPESVMSCSQEDTMPDVRSVTIVGGGVIGCFLAYRLALEGVALFTPMSHLIPLPM